MDRKAPNSNSSSSLERLVPDDIKPGEATGMTTLELHIERYKWARRHLDLSQGSVDILDAACGVGYGTAILSKDSSYNVVGVDISSGAVEYARSRYASGNTRFVVQDLNAYGEDESSDAIVSLETIEHVPDPQLIIRNFNRVLRPGGLFILSVPVTPSVDANPHHLTDFTVSSIKKLLSESGFTVINEFTQVQKFNPLRMISANEERLADMRENLPAYYLKNPAAALKRIASTLRHGFSNRYLTLACTKTN